MGAIGRLTRVRFRFVTVAPWCAAAYPAHAADGSVGRRTPRGRCPPVVPLRKRRFVPARARWPALGGLAVGCLALGGAAIGGVAIGYYAVGGAAFGVHPFGPLARTEAMPEWLGRLIPWTRSRP